MIFDPTYRLPLSNAKLYEATQDTVGELKGLIETAIPGQVVIQLGEIQVTPRVVAATEPGMILKYVAHHQIGTDLTEEERSMRCVTRELHGGRYVTKWPTLPIVLSTPEGWRIWNERYANTIIAIVTLADEKLTVVCLEDELPKVGAPGYGAGMASDLTEDINAAIVDSDREGLL